MKIDSMQYFVGQILGRISEGERLTNICKDPRMPSYNVICRWRREDRDFDRQITLAYEDRVQEIQFKILKLESLKMLYGISVQDEMRVLKKELHRQIGVRYPRLNEKVDRGRHGIEINTGFGVVRI